MNHVNQMLSAKAVEYARNSSQAMGKINREIKVSTGGKPWAMLSAAITTPVLYNTKKPKKGPAMGVNDNKQIMKLFPKIDDAL